MRRLLLIGMFFVAGAAGAAEPKSADECRSELGPDVIGDERQKKVMECLLSHIPAEELDRPRSEPSDGSGPFYVKYLHHSVNTAGGVEIDAGFVNPGHQSAVKYIVLNLRMFNAVGDVITSRIGGQSTGVIRYTGPLTSDAGVADASWNPLWYNGSAACVRIESVQVILMNGKTFRFQGPALRKALSQRISNDCRPTVR